LEPGQERFHWKKREKRAGAGERVKSLPLEIPLVDSNGRQLPFAPEPPQYVRQLRAPGRDCGVNQLCIFVGTTVGGYLGWWAGEQLGCEFFVNFLLSGVGSVAGVYAGWKLARKLAE
jgi:hypothetical protein